MFDYSDISEKRAQKTHEGVAEKEARKIRLPKTLAVIDQSGCTGCEACIQFCPVDCIELVPGPSFPDMNKTVEVDLDRCIGCKLCAKYCPWDTIHMIKSDDSYETANEWTLRSVVKIDRPLNDLWGEEEEPEPDPEPTDDPDAQKTEAKDDQTQVDETQKAS